MGASMALSALAAFLFVFPHVNSQQVERPPPPDISKDISCSNEFPTWDGALPPGYTREDYGTLQTLCQTDDENPGLPTLGGECSLKNDPPEVIFRQDKMHPIFRGLLRNRRGKALQWYCYAKCTCKDRPEERDRTKSDKVDVSNQLTIDVADGAVKQIWHSPGKTTNTVNVLAPFDTPNKQYAAPFTTGELRRQRRPAASDSGRGYGQPVCGGKCTDASDCQHGASGPSSCSCVAVAQKDRLVLGVERTLWTAALCLAVHGTGKKLNGRGVGDSGPRSFSQACVCNATFVSEACCGTADGIVAWDQPNRGTLLIREQQN